MKFSMYAGALLTTGLTLVHGSTGLGVKAQASQPALERGVYLETGAGESAIDRLRATMVMDTETKGSTAMAMFGKMPSIVFNVPGAAAERRLTTAEPTFRLVLTPSKFDPRSGGMPDMSAFSMDAPAAPVKSPDDFVLVKLTPKEDTRTLDSKSAPRVDMTAEKLGSSVYRVRLKKPLDAGEYAFCVRVGKQITGQLWEFGLN
jgi:hypothetical protein